MASTQHGRSVICHSANEERLSVQEIPRAFWSLHPGCTRAPEKSVILMVETAAVVPTGDQRLTKTSLPRTSTRN
jgi:hypothetical protein